MKLKEARTILGLSDNATEEEAKKAFKEQAKITHPDNKETGSEEKFKQINEAYQRIKEGGSDEIKFDNISYESYGQGNININDIFSGNSGGSFNLEDLFNGINSGGFNKKQHKVKYNEDINLNAEISFKDAILGCSYDVKFKRKTPCEKCNGQGVYSIHNGCKKCNGSGYIVKENKLYNTTTHTTCQDCYGKVKKENCKDCNHTGVIEKDTEASVNIPAGVVDKNILRLNGMGHYNGSSFMGASYSNAFLHLKIKENNGLYLENKDVISKLSISLLEALEGCKKTTKTIDGDKEIEIPKLTKNKDELIIPKLGVSRKGNQRVLLTVDYPNDIDKLIQALK